jgi:hypothetical protein
MDWPASIGHKLDRAHVQLAAVGAEIALYIKGNPYRTTLDEHHHDARVIFQVIRPPPPGISILIGEVVHNARCALDHLVYALALANNRVPDPKSGFPIFETEKGFNGRGIDIIRPLDPRAIEIIRELQPYHMGQDAQRHPLWVLYHLSNIDKHRHLGAVIGSIRGPWVQLMEPDDGPIAMFPDMAAGVFYDGDEIARFPATRHEVVRRQLELEGQLTAFVALDEGTIWRGEPVEQVLLRTLGFIRDRVLPRFRPFFL